MIVVNGIGVDIEVPAQDRGPIVDFSFAEVVAERVEPREFPFDSLLTLDRHADGGERQACRGGGQQPGAPVLLSGKTYLRHFERMSAEDCDPLIPTLVVPFHAQLATVTFALERGNYGFVVACSRFLEAHDVGLVVVEPLHNLLNPSIESAHVPSANPHGGGEHISYEMLWRPEYVGERVSRSPTGSGARRRPAFPCRAPRQWQRNAILLPMTLPAIIEAIDALEDIGRRQDIELVVMGGIRDGVDAVKALCLGADAVAFGTSTIIAGGCIACMQCHIGQCVTGIATQDPEHEKRYDPQAESHNIHRFLEGVRWQIAALTHALGHTDFRALNRDDLVALTPEAAEITGLPHEPGLRAKTPELRVRSG